jgi:amino-acid N-acetyltransferase
MIIPAEFRFASPSDETAVRQLLAASGLPSADISTDRQDIILALSGRQIIGCVALELYGDAALLRSFAVAADVRSRGVGTALYGRVLAQAALRGAKTAYVLTTTAERFCSREGFEKMERAAVPAAVAASAEFRTLCPATAVCMRRRLDGDARHFPADVLRLRPDVPGASMWAVALERTMLTYFEIEPRSRFQTHSHASEQITMVLDGELFFEVAGGMEVLVRAGEVIAIPANAPHAAWTGDRRARAVDSWSPVRLDFIR